MEPNNFDPDDMEEMSELFAHIYEDAHRGYIMEFTISRLAARDLVGTWNRARTGDAQAVAACVREYGRIMGELENALAYDEYDEYD